jgi:OOP family OmpA-OmpF porin
MKKTLLAALTSAALLSPWVAHAENSYVKLDAGQAKYSAEGVSENKTGFALAFGQSLHTNWGYEVGYVNFGKVSDSYIDSDTGALESGSLRSQAVYVAGVGTLPFNDAFSAYGKLGIAAVNTKGAATTTSPSGVDHTSGSETKTNLMAGVGLAYNFSKDVAATVEYNYYGKSVENLIKLSTWTVGLKYGF